MELSLINQGLARNYQLLKALKAVLMGMHLATRVVVDIRIQYRCIREKKKN